MTAREIGHAQRQALAQGTAGLAAVLEGVAERLPELLVRLGELGSLDGADREAIRKALHRLAVAWHLIPTDNYAPGVVWVRYAPLEGGGVREGIGVVGEMEPRHILLMPEEIAELRAILDQEEQARAEFDYWIGRAREETKLRLLFARLDLGEVARALRAVR